MHHRWYTHYKCSTDAYCPVCDGGLSWCEICNGAEASLTTHCPERPLTEAEEAAVTARALDYVDGCWISLQ